jgi:hypothetical protein
MVVDIGEPRRRESAPLPHALDVRLDSHFFQPDGGA